jgi:monoamine oxidase
LSTDVDIAIVGGGAAGVGAARRLARSGLSVQLLEASSRLGGRAWTQENRGLDLDLGCGWLHSADRNAWAVIAKHAGVPLDQSRAAWGVQYHDLGFTPAEQAEAWQAFESWTQRLAHSPPASDCAADALEPGGKWNAHIRAIVSFISGARLENLSAADYAAYDESSSENNWRLRSGFGALIARSFPRKVSLSLAAPVESISLAEGGVKLATPTGAIRARAALLTVSTAVLAGDSIKLPSGLDPWRDAARRLPLGLDEKLFLEIIGDAPFEAETHVTGNPRDERTASYYIRPFDWPVIECFFGGERARLLAEEGLAAGFSFAIEQLTHLFGADIRSRLRPLAASNWTRSARVGGAYSYALPGHVAARRQLAQPFEQRVFFAGEATSAGDFSTAHGAHDSGIRAADEAVAALRKQGLLV